MMRDNLAQEHGSITDDPPESRDVRSYGMVVTALVIAASIAVVIDLVAT